MGFSSIEFQVSGFDPNRDLFSVRKDILRNYSRSSPILIPFSGSGTLFGTNSGKTSTNVSGILCFSAHSAVGGHIEAENDR